MNYLVPAGLLYTRQHEWARVEEDETGKGVRVGVTDYAQAKLGEVVYVRLPKPGSFKKGSVLAELEAYKGVAEVYAPVSGELVAANDVLRSSPELVNQDPYGKGWIALLKPSNMEAEIAELLNPEEYSKIGGKDERRGRRSLLAAF
ncbi:MAG: glycine cleavage system protein GcvH [Thermoprotei archaeon]|nr:glycine cleavage system protein GcvH [TACK group archaeon]